MKPFRYAVPPKRNKTLRIRGRITQYILARAAKRPQITWRNLVPPLTKLQATTNLRGLSLQGKLKVARLCSKNPWIKQPTIYQLP